MGRGGGGPAKDAATDAAEVALAEIEARRKAARSGEPDEIEIAPDAFDAVRLFFALASQWRVHPMAGVRLGLDYPAIPVTATMMGLTMTPELFDDMAVMERAALAAWASKG